MYYIFNETNKKKLEIPKIGLWYTNDLNEAKEMQKDFRNYLKSVGLKNMIQYIQVIDSETEKVVA